MIRPLPLAAALAALFIGSYAPAAFSDEVGDPSMKFFYPDGSIQWEDQHDLDRDAERIERARKQRKDAKGGWKDPDRQKQDEPAGTGSGTGQSQP